MPPLAKAKYIRQWLSESAGGSAFPFGECVSTLNALGIKTDYDILLQSDVLERAPTALHRDIKALRMAVLQHFACDGNSAQDLLANASSLPQIPEYLHSGIQGLDLLLDGGLRVGQVTEICGSSGSGRSQIAIEFTAEHLMPSKPTSDIATANRKVFYLQSSRLPVWRVEQALRKRVAKHPPDMHNALLKQAMERLHVVDCSDIDALLTFLYKYADARENAHQPSNANQTTNPSAASSDLLVIDSIRPLVVSAIQLENDAHVYVHAVKIALRRITALHCSAATAVLVVNGISQRNQATLGDSPSNYHRNSSAFVQPSLGASWLLVSHVQLFIYSNAPQANAGATSSDDSRAYENYITAVVLKSPCTPVDRRASFSIAYS
ncbi:DNA repair protein rad51d [Dipsacomyces acuminosporus]|nr:DNA repair protein rad51d [Dipsacomyces acuminosporus]